MDPWGTPQLRVIEREETFLQAEESGKFCKKKKNQTDKTESPCVLQIRSRYHQATEVSFVL